MCHPPPKGGGRTRLLAPVEVRAPLPVAIGDGGGTSPSAKRDGSWSPDPSVSRASPSPQHQSPTPSAKGRRVPIPKSKVLEQWVAQSNDLEWAAVSFTRETRKYGDHNPSATSWPQGCATRRALPGGRSRELPRRHRRRGVARPRARSARGRGRLIQEARACTPGQPSRTQTRGDHNPSATSWPQGCATRRALPGGRSRELPRRPRRRGWHVPEREARGVVVA